ncbi:MAG: AHH domain-containing protein [Novosphingobium sp.]|nr:AHH domain-containing protein [Novosphingobium sp.]
MLNGRSRIWAGRSEAPPLPFRAVNRTGQPGHVAGLQRHHLLPRVLVRHACFARLLDVLDERAGLDDFRRNGMLLPATEGGAMRMGLPLHRGPHRAYSEMVGERLGGIEAGWAKNRMSDGDAACVVALYALAELQADLRRSLLDPRRTFRLNASDLLGGGTDFARLDAMAETLWRATQPVNVAVLAESAAIAA